VNEAENTYTWHVLANSQAPEATNTQVIIEKY
ncbi:unnamed protein product, partial [marine sediment metagenome]